VKDENDTSTQLEAEPESEQDLDTMENPQAVAHLAALQFSRAQIALIIGEPIGEELEPHYQRGLLLGEAKVRNAIKRLAMAGSSPAQAQYLELIRDRESQDRAPARGRGRGRK
jgi:hypothetical protein